MKGDRLRAYDNTRKALILAVLYAGAVGLAVVFSPNLGVQAPQAAISAPAVPR
jgi:hypothetical protein